MLLLATSSQTAAFIGVGMMLLGFFGALWISYDDGGRGINWPAMPFVVIFVGGIVVLANAHD